MSVELPHSLWAPVEALVGTAHDLAPSRDRDVVLDTFRPWRETLIWSFNRLFWQRFALWKRSSTHESDLASVGEDPDGHCLDAIVDSVGDFWTLVRDLDARGRLPSEVYAMEIGVGTGARARLWLDRFKALDDDCGTGYYSRLRFLLGDYSIPTLDRALGMLGPHASLASVIPIDAVNPVKTLSFLRFKVLFVHLTNVYSNLSFDEIVRRDRQLCLVEVRPYITAAAAQFLCNEFAFKENELRGAVNSLLTAGPEFIGDVERGAHFWACLWSALRMEERLRGLDEGEDGHLPSGVGRAPFDDLLADAPADVRFHLSRGAVESFVNTVPLLHPRGYLQVQDRFVPSMSDYALGCRGPAKAAGTFVTSVNGAFLRAVGARAGYDVHFAPFRYRSGSQTQILYTTPRD